MGKVDHWLCKRRYLVKKQIQISCVGHRYIINVPRTNVEWSYLAKLLCILQAIIELQRRLSRWFWFGMFVVRTGTKTNTPLPGGTRILHKCFLASSKKAYECMKYNKKQSTVMATSSIKPHTNFLLQFKAIGKLAILFYLHGTVRARHQFFLILLNNTPINGSFSITNGNHNNLRSFWIINHCFTVFGQALNWNSFFICCLANRIVCDNGNVYSYVSIVTSVNRGFRFDKKMQ